MRKRNRVLREYRVIKFWSRVCVVTVQLIYYYNSIKMSNFQIYVYISIIKFINILSSEKIRQYDIFVSPSPFINLFDWL